MTTLPHAVLGQVKRQAYEIYLYSGPDRYVLQIKNGFVPGVFLDGVKIADLDKDKVTYIEARFEFAFPGSHVGLLHLLPACGGLFQANPCGDV
jgi:hypothetical protein